MSLTSFPPPQRNSKLLDEDIFSYGHQFNTYEQYQKEYLRKISSEASRVKNQYLSIEEELLRSFQYVHPTVKNLSTTSVRFATIIRESANLYEILSRSIYFKLYDIPNNTKINVIHFLSLESFLDLSNATINAPTLQSELENTDLFQPFKVLTSWDRISTLKEKNIPSWWTAYNKLKHNVNGIDQYATLENSILSLGAIYLTIDRIYGTGVIGGKLYKPERVNSLVTNLIEQHVPISSLFVEDAFKFSVGL